MKKYFYLSVLLLGIFTFVSCSDDEDDVDYTWKNTNEEAFNALADSVQSDPADFVVVSVPQGPGYIYCKKLSKEGTATDNPKYTSLVRVHYKGQLVNGIVFADQWYSAPFDFKIDGTSYYLNGVGYSGIAVIKGWQVALQNMTEGETWRIWIPSALGYGISASGSIPAYSTLIFDIKLEKILQMYPLTKDES